jgi:flagellar biosynthesis protein FliR
VTWPVLNDEAIIIFLLVLTRTGAFFSIFPAFGGGNVPIKIKVGAAASLAILIHSTVVVTGTLPVSLPGLLLLMGRETLVGLLLGSLVAFVFMAAQFAGQAIGVQMGLAAASLFDPTTRETVSVTGRFYYLLAILIFLTLNLHLQFLAGFARSFDIVPIGGTGIPVESITQFAKLSGKVLVLGMRLSLPVIGALLILDTALGFMARLVPQMNIFLFGFPLKITVGFVVLAMGVGPVTRLMRRSLTLLLEDFYLLMNWMG